MGLFKKLVSGALTFALAAGLAAAAVPASLTAAESTKNVSLGVQAIAPQSGSKWEKGGDTVYYGNYNGSAVQYRVLKSESGKLLLDCNTVLYNSGIGHAWPSTGKWDGSTLQSELNGSTFYGNTGVFNTVEKNAIALTANAAKGYYAYQSGTGSTGGECQDYATNDYIFLLSAQEITDLYEYKNSRSTRAKDGEWWTRSNYQASGQTIYVDTSGTLKNAVSTCSYGVSPAFNVNESSVAFTVAAGTGRSTFASTYTATANSWVFALYDGSGFNASLAGSSSVDAGGSVSVRVNSTASGNVNAYNQISALLVDSNGTVAAYGKVSANVSTGNISVTIPSGVSQGSYTLKVFAESASSASNATSYVSNMSDISITVGSGSSDNSSSYSTNNGTSNKSNAENGSKEDYADGWNTINGVEYWYENGIRQGVRYNDDGTPDISYRGKEIFDSASNAWYWLDCVQYGAKTVSKDVYQESLADDEGNIGKWVRYDENGHMIKGWSSDGRYYFDMTYGTMAKGYYTIDGIEYYFNAETSILEGTTGITGLAGYTGWKSLAGCDYWFENGQRQGCSTDASYRGKEIFDPASNAWYWLDNVDAGKKAVSKDVYQESDAGDWGVTVNGNGTRIGKWVRYDANGHMIKGWQYTDEGTYYFDLTYGTMAKGTVEIDGKTYTFDSSSGKRIY